MTSQQIHDGGGLLHWKSFFSYISAPIIRLTRN